MGLDLAGSRRMILLRTPPRFALRLGGVSRKFAFRDDVGRADARGAESPRLGLVAQRGCGKAETGRRLGQGQEFHGLPLRGERRVVSLLEGDGRRVASRPSLGIDDHARRAALAGLDVTGLGPSVLVHLVLLRGGDHVGNLDARGQIVKRQSA